METIWWKTRVTSTRMFERMKFLCAYWGRKPNGAPGREFPVSHVLLRAVELAFNEVQADLRAAQNGVIGPAEKNRAEWWLKMARDGRNGDPFPGVSYPAAEACWLCQATGPLQLAAKGTSKKCEDEEACFNRCRAHDHARDAVKSAERG